MEQENYFRAVKPIRTYERDLAELVREKEASQAKVRLEEQEKKGKKKEKVSAQTAKIGRQTSDYSAVKKVIVLGLIFLVILGGVLISLQIGRIIQNKRIVKEIPPERTISADTIIRGDSLKIVPITQLNRENLLTEIKNKKENLVPNSGINILHITQSVATQEVALTADQFLETLRVRAPSSLIRSLGRKMEFGFVAKENVSPFLILEIDSFEHAFAGMLSWENNLAGDLRELIAKDREVRGNFEDMTVRNRDLRILRGRAGETITLYSFLDNRHLLITDEVGTFREILDRFLLISR